MTSDTHHAVVAPERVPAPVADPAAVSGWDCHVHVFDADWPVRQSGHYRPADAHRAALERLAQPLGIGHAVLVQPSVYGTDNGLLLHTLGEGRGVDRGIVVLAGDTPVGDLQRMHALGVRGVRVNRVSPVGNGVADLVPLVPALRALGWHVQWYARPVDLPGIAAWHAAHGLVCVLDHLGGLTAADAREGASPQAWEALARLAGQGAWIKLSGWYRLDAAAPYDMLDGAIARAAALFGPRSVWGSDWPHTRFAEPGCTDTAPPYDALWNVVERVLGQAQARRILVDQPQALYR